MTTPVFIFGAGPQGRVVLDILRSSNAVVAGFLDDRATSSDREVSGLRILNAGDWLASDRPGAVVVAIGHNRVRMDVGNRIVAAGRHLHTAIHRSVVIGGDVEIGAGSVCMMGAAVATGCRLGVNVVVNSGVTLDHDSIVEDGAYLAPGVHTAGAVRIGARAFIGAGAILGPSVTIAHDAIVGAGSVVLNDIPANALAFGAPARVQRTLDGDADWSRILGGRRAGQ